MTALTMTRVDPDPRPLYRMGSASALGLGAGYIAIFLLYAHVGAPPSQNDGELWLKYFDGKATSWWCILGVSVLTDFLFVPLALALYVALKAVNEHAMLLATAFIGLFVVLDLAVTWSNFAALITLSGQYVVATNDIQRGSYVAAANYPSAVLTSRLFVVYAIVVLSVAILVIGWMMRKAAFSKPAAYLGLATGMCGVVSVAGMSVTIIANAVLATAWVFVVGYRLHRLSQQT